MMEPQEHEDGPTLVDLAQRLDSEDMIGFLRQTVNDLRRGFAAVNPEAFPWLEQLRQAPWTGVLCLGMGGSAAGGDFLAALTSQHGPCPAKNRVGSEPPDHKTGGFGCPQGWPVGRCHRKPFWARAYGYSRNCQCQRPGNRIGPL